MIRPASPDDAVAMAATFGGWIAETGWIPDLHGAKADLAFCASLIEKDQVWVADCRDGLGFLALRNDQIMTLYLPASLRGQGWGKALLTTTKAGHFRLTLWVFQANTDAIRFYRREGFVVAGFTNGESNAENLPDAHMIWERTL